MFESYDLLVVADFISCSFPYRRSSNLLTLNFLMVLSLDRMCQRGLHAVLLSHIGTLMHRLAAEPCSTTGLLFFFLVSLWNDLANRVFDGVGPAGFKSRANAS